MNSTVFNLNRIQKRFWTNDSLVSTNQNNLAFVFKISGKLDLDILHRSLHTIVSENPLLHAYIRQNGHEEPYWDVNDNFVLSINTKPFLFESEEDINLFADKKGQEPFDLQNEYPCKFYLLKKSCDNYYLMIKMHHIIIDAPRFLVFTERLSELYNKILNNNTTAPLNTKSIGDFLDWDRKIYTEEKKKADLAYWRTYIDQTDFTIPLLSAESEEEITLLPFRLGQDLKNKCLSFCKEYQTSLFRLYASTWGITITRLFNVDDLFLNYAVDICPEAFRKTIGVYINNLLLHVSNNESARFMDVITQLSTDRRDAKKHQDFLLSGVTQYFLQSNMSDHVINSIGFNYPIAIWNNPSLLRLNGCETYLYRRVVMEPANDLMLEINDDKNAQSFILAKKKFPRYIIQCLADSFKHLLATVIENPLIKINKIPLASTSFQAQIIQSNSLNISQHPPFSKSVVDVFKQIVKEHENDLAIITAEKKLTFKTLDALSDQVALAISSKYTNKEHSTSCKQRIGLYSVRNEYMLISILGILKAGCSYVPLDISIPEERINFILSDSQTSLVLVNHPRGITFSTAASLSIEEALKNTNQHKLPIISLQNEAYVIYTSGTSGTPKGVPILHENLINVVNARHTYIPVKENKVELFFANIVFDASVLEIFPPLLTGTPVYVTTEEERHDPNQLLRVLINRKITCACIPPALLSIMPYTPLPDLKYLVVAGESTSQQVINKWRQTAKIINAYGPTENTVCSTICVMDEQIPSNDIGTPLPGVSCYVLDEYAQILPDGVIGELYIGGLQLTNGYIYRSELNKEKFIDNPFITLKDKELGINTRLYRSGDLVKRMPNGHLLFIGRKDTQVKIRGYRIETGEIEAQLCQYPAINQALVCVHEQNERKMLVAYVQVNSPDNIKPRQVIDFLNNKLPDYMLPASIIPLAILPLTANGKVDRKKLPEPDLQIMSPKTDLMPVSPLEKEVAGVWQGLLHVENVSMNDNFISLGGDSLLIIQMAMLLEKQFDIRIQAAHIFKYPVLKDLVSLVQEKRQNGETIKNLPKLAPGIPVSLAPSQKSLWLQCNYSKEVSTAYHVSIALSVNGVFDHACLESAFNQLLEHHESLRLFFPINPTTGIPQIETRPYSYYQIEKKEIAPNQMEDFLREYIKTEMDLSKGPLFHALIVKLSTDHHMLVFVFHHLIIDGISCNLFRDQLLDTYQALLNGSNYILSKSPYRYIDYAFIQNQKTPTGKMEKIHRFWNAYLANCSDLDLPVDKSTSNRPDYEGGLFDLKLPDDLSRRIYSFCEELAITPFIFFLSLYQLLLIRYMRQFNFVVGIPYSNRRYAEFKNLIGYFIYTLPIRPLITDIRDQTLFADYVIQLQSDMGNAVKHTLSFDKILEACGNRQNFQTSTPLIQAMFSFGNFEIDKQFKGYSIQSVSMLRDITAFPISLEITPLNDTFNCKLQYETSKFSQEAIHGMTNGFYNLIEQALKQRKTPMMRLSLLSDQEMLAYIEQNRVEAKLTQHSEQAVSVFKRVAHSHMNKKAVIMNSATLTYQQLDELSDKIAKSICLYHERNGFRTPIGQRIGLYSDRNIYLLPAIMGILKSGCSYVPLDKAYPEERINFMLKDSEATLVLQNTSDIPQLDIPFVLSLSEILAQRVEFNLPSFDKKTEAYLIYTSGTTGIPKGVPILHENLLNTVNNRHTYIPVEENKVELSYSNIAFDSSIIEIFSPLLTGVPIYLTTEEERHDPAALLQALDFQKITSAFIPPALLSMMPYTPLPYLKYLTVAGESTSPLVIERWSQTTNVINAYGPTENTVCSSICFMTGNSPANDIGMPLPGISYYVLDENLQLLPDHIVGELYIGGLQLTKGYFNRPELNNEKFIPNPFATNEEIKAGLNTHIYNSGDLVKRMPNGHIYFMGRADFQVKIRGYRIEIGEIESRLAQHPNIKQAFVTTYMEADEKHLVAYLLKKETNIDIKELKLYLALSMPTYMIPTYWCVVDHFPLTVNGKIDRKNLPIPTLVNASDYIPPSSASEILLTDIISSTIGMDKISVEADLIDLGLTSIQIMLIALEAQTHGIDISVSSFYQNRSIRNILKEKQSSLFFWGNEYKKEKPLVILISGYPYFQPFYQPFIEYFKDDYSFFVFEAIHEYFNQKTRVTLSELLNFYKDIIGSVLKGKEIYAITGYCLGAEIALSLAQELKLQNKTTPKVLMLEGIFQRPKNQPIPEVENKLIYEHYRISTELTNSFPPLTFDGEMLICMAKKRSNRLSLEFTEEVTDPIILEAAREAFIANLSNWKREFPQSPYYEIDADHWSFFELEPLKELRAIIKKHWSNETHP